MRRIFKASLLLVLFCAPALSRQQPPAARLIDSFGEIQYSDLMARLDNFAIELQNEPASSGVVVTYASKQKFPGWPQRRAKLAVAYLTETRGLDASRLSTFNGPLRDETTFDLWVVPQGAELPVKPFDVSLLMAGEKTPLLLDRFTVIERGDNIQSEYNSDFRPSAVGLYALFAEALRSDPGLRGCVIGYTSRHGYSAAGRRIAASAKMAIAKGHAIEVSRIAALGGGRREYKMIELWLVPPGAEMPKPTPPARRPRRRRR